MAEAGDKPSDRCLTLTGSAGGGLHHPSPVVLRHLDDRPPEGATFVKHLARPIAVLACSAAIFSPMALTSSASASSGAAANPSAHSHTAPCTITAADRAALLDQLA